MESRSPRSLSDDLVRIARAEDRRRGGDLPGDARRRSDVNIRRAAARALARILDADDGPLLSALEDEDDEVVAWASYGLGESCKGHEDRHVRALAARLASLVADRGSAAGRTGHPLEGDTRLGRRVVATTLRALGRCGSDAAEAILRHWVGGGGEDADAACYAIGDIAARRGSLSSYSAGALLDAALASPPTEAALEPFSRPEVAFGGEFGARLASAARASLAREGPLGVFAVRALARTHAPGVADDLTRILMSDSASPSERVEAAAGLALPPPSRMVALGQAISSLTRRRAPLLAGDDYVVLLSAVERFDVGESGASTSILDSLARVRPASVDVPADLRRASALRCAAAANRVRNPWDDTLRECDLGDGEVGEQARLGVLERGALLGSRRFAWVSLTRSAHLRIREAALQAIPRHPELGDAAREALAAALTAEEPGVVATAAKIVHAHPGRVFVLAASERRAALDAASPPPTSTPAMEIDAAVARALRTALARAWRPDLVETRVALFEAALTVGVEEGREAARKGCADDNVTVRARAGAALAAAGEAPCAPPDLQGAGAAAEIGHVLSSPTRVSFEMESGTVAIVFDPALAPIAVTHLVALARSGFYEGGAVHRVVPGFVVQFGDPQGDGYGGSGELMRCETSPVPFDAFDVGVAIAGRDTGSSQIFVTLAPEPQLDGQYAWVGRAQGDWNSIAQGDQIRAVRVEEQAQSPK
ncbi:MAG TPA: peptidylprolyl isomerase [Polyangiaceae bacterium]|nr:peptidylprolyl isomerase [Polyangiaceae bacterium]